VILLVLPFQCGVAPTDCFRYNRQIAIS